MKTINKPGHEATPEQRVDRRSFLRYAGFTAAATAIVIAGCKKDYNAATPMDQDAIDLGSGDTGILNYAYTLEQLEAAFYTQVAAHTAFTSTFNAEEQQLLKDVRDHEIVHREFLKAALAANAIRELEFDFSGVNFGNRDSVLSTARTFEDLGVAAYNGAGRLLKDGNLLLVAGKIVSVEARHAAAIRDLLQPRTAAFAGDDVVSTDRGLDGALPPMDVLGAAQPFIKNKINGNNLPTS